MKKILFAAIALCSVLSCTKEGLEVGNEAKPIVFTAEIAGEKTTVTNDGKVNWVIGDEVTISDDESTGIYAVSEVDAHRFATLEYKSGTKFTKAGIYTANYGDVNNQWYDESCPGANCPMSANGETDDLSTVQFSFNNDCGVVAVKANTGDNKIAQIKIGNKTLNFATPQALDETKTYLVAVTPDEDFTEVAFVKDDGSKASKTIATSSVERNRIRNLDTKTYFSTATYDGFEPIALPGVFVLNSGKKICFSRGNVYTSTSTSTDYKMEAEQYYCNNDKIPESKNHNARFSWTQSGPGPYASQFSSKDNSVFPGWRLLTVAEFEELLGYKTWSKIDFNDKSCDICFQIGTGSLIGKAFFPDGFVWDETTMGEKPTKTCQGGVPTVRTEDNYKALTSAGAVILIANGYRTSYINYGAYYWFFNGTEGKVVNFTYSLINWEATKYESSVRLVKEL